MANLPSADFAINTIWLQLVLAAQVAIGFRHVLCLGEVRKAACPQ